MIRRHLHLTLFLLALAPSGLACGGNDGPDTQLQIQQCNACAQNTATTYPEQVMILGEPDERRLVITCDAVPETRAVGISGVCDPTVLNTGLSAWLEDCGLTLPEVCTTALQ